MNLKEFLDYRPNCPICDHKLSMGFLSTKKQRIRYENDGLIVVFNMRPLNKGQKAYQVGYSFSLKDNTWCTEFYNKDGVKFENEAPEHLRHRFKEYHEHVYPYKFYRTCGKCSSYHCDTSGFNLNFKKGTYPAIKIHSEYFGMRQALDKTNKIYKLYNNYSNGKSTLIYCQNPMAELTQYDYLVMSNRLVDGMDTINTSLIKFTTANETMERIQKLLIFS